MILWCRNLAELSRFTGSSGVKRWHPVPSDAPSQAQLCPGTFLPKQHELNLVTRNYPTDPGWGPSYRMWGLTSLKLRRAWKTGNHGGTIPDWRRLRRPENEMQRVVPQTSSIWELAGNAESSTSTHTSDLRNQKLHFSKIPMMPVHI